MSSWPSQPVDVAVVGAGFAGLMAARCIADAGYSVAVLEARERVGGKSYTHMGEAGATDLGAHWVGGDHHEVIALAETFALQLVPCNLAGQHIVHLSGQRRSTARAYHTALPPAQRTDCERLIGTLDALAVTIPVDAPWSAPEAQALDAQSVADWLRSQNPLPETSAYFAPMIRSIFCAELEAISLLFFLYYLNAAGGWQAWSGEGAGGALDRVVRGGTQQIAEGMARELVGCVHLSAPVERIDHGDEGVRLVTGRGAIQARYALVALSPMLAGRITMPGLPRRRDLLNQHAPMGAVIKVAVRYSAAHWRTRGYSGTILADEVPWCFSTEANLDEQGAELVTFIVADDASAWREQSPAQRRARFLAALADYFGPELLQPLAYYEHDWSAEAYGGGCYHAVLPPGVLSQYGPTLREPWGRVHWAGAETAPRWFGHMEGALVSGRRAAVEVLKRLAENT